MLFSASPLSAEDDSFGFAFDDSAEFELVLPELSDPVEGEFNEPADPTLAELEPVEIELSPLPVIPALELAEPEPLTPGELESMLRSLSL